MARKPYDPLAIIPSPKAVREKLEETLALADRLKILLDTSERVYAADRTNAHVPATAQREVAHAG